MQLSILYVGMFSSSFLQNCTPAELNDLDNSSLMRLEDFNLMESYAGSGIGIEIYPDIAMS